MTVPAPPLRPGDAPSTTAAADPDRPWVSILLIAYRQADTVGAALRGALAQTYSPLEILVSDDASGDGTWDAILAAAAGYAGPHRLRLNRNHENLGIGAHLSHLASQAEGELLVVAAGDDVSRPERCERLVEAWLAAGRRPDLLSSSLLDIDADGRVQGQLVPTDLGRYRDLALWVAEPPYIVGAAQAWTRRLFERFGPLPRGVVAEDLVMVFRALAGGGGAISLPDALVEYRRGGISRRVRVQSADQVSARWIRNARHATVEMRQMLADAERAGVLPVVQDRLQRELDREQAVLDVFDAPDRAARWRALWRAPRLRAGFRWRLFLYGVVPELLAPWFALKRRARG